MENINLLRKIVWSFHKSTGVDWDDLFQEAAYAYFTSIEKYDPKKGKLSTHVWHCVSNHLKNYLREEFKQTGFIDYHEALEDILPNLSTNHPTFFDSLTDDAKYMANIVLSSQKKFVVLSTEQAKTRLIRIMLKNGWNGKRITKALLNLKKVCSTK